MGPAIVTISFFLLIFLLVKSFLDYRERTMKTVKLDKQHFEKKENENA